MARSPSAPEPTQRWPSIERQLDEAKAIHGSKFEEFIRANQETNLLRPEEHNGDGVGVPLWLRVYYRKQHPTEPPAPGSKAAFADLIPRFKGGSTPDDEIPTAALIRKVLTESRAHLLETLSRFGDKDLGTIPEFIKERKLALVDVLNIIAWHEPHHQGQAHITFNLWKVAQG